MLPYIRGDEVWAVCRVYLQSIVEEITEGDVSTSPSVVFNSTSGNVEVQEGDTNFLIEGVPFLVDHIALVDVYKRQPIRTNMTFNCAACA